MLRKMPPTRPVGQRAAEEHLAGAQREPLPQLVEHAGIAVVDDDDLELGVLEVEQVRHRVADGVDAARRQDDAHRDREARAGERVVGLTAVAEAPLADGVRRACGRGATGPPKA